MFVVIVLIWSLKYRFLFNVNIEAIGNDRRAYILLFRNLAIIWLLSKLPYVYMFLVLLFFPDRIDSGTCAQIEVFILSIPVVLSLKIFIRCLFWIIISFDTHLRQVYVECRLSTTDYNSSNDQLHSISVRRSNV